MPLSCPKCETPLIAKREQQGELVQCPICETKLRLPASSRDHDFNKDSNAVTPVELVGGNLNDPVLDALVAPTPNPQGSSRTAPPRKHTPRNGHQKKFEPTGASTGLMAAMLAIGLTGILAVIIAVVYKSRANQPTVEKAETDKAAVSQPATGEFILHESPTEHRLLPANEAMIESEKRSGSVQIWE